MKIGANFLSSHPVHAHALAQRNTGRLHATCPDRKQVRRHSLASGQACILLLIYLQGDLSGQGTPVVHLPACVSLHFMHSHVAHMYTRVCGFVLYGQLRVYRVVLVSRDVYGISPQHLPPHYEDQKGGRFFKNIYIATLHSLAFCAPTTFLLWGRFPHNRREGGIEWTRRALLFRE